MSQSTESSPGLPFEEGRGNSTAVERGGATVGSEGELSSGIQILVLDEREHFGKCALHLLSCFQRFNSAISLSIRIEKKWLMPLYPA